MEIKEYCPLLSRSPATAEKYAFTYQGIEFSQTSFHIFAGLNAVDNPINVEKTMQTLHKFGLNCARMGAFKPRTSPYSFQGLGANCLPYVFELAGKYAIKIIAMEVTHDSQLELIDRALEYSGNPTGVLLQIGTRNAQNFELLKAVGSQQKFPILYKRGYGITLDESLTACEYLAHAGNQKIIFCLRGMKSQYGAPHRNFVDFAQVPVIKRLTKMPVCIDPSHAVGNYAIGIDNIPDLLHACAQGIIAGANMLLVDIHPNPAESLVDALQAIDLHNFAYFIDDVNLCRDAYLRRVQLIQDQ